MGRNNQVLVPVRQTAGEDNKKKAKKLSPARDKKSSVTFVTFVNEKYRFSPLKV